MGSWLAQGQAETGSKMPKVLKGETGVRKQVAEILAMIRPAVQGDGGDIELVDVTADGVVQVRLHGACVGCPSAAMTLKLGVEHAIRERLPEILEVVCV